MRTEEVADGSRLSADARFESLVAVSNAIGTHRGPQDLFSALVRELHRVKLTLFTNASHDQKRESYREEHNTPAVKQVPPLLNGAWHTCGPPFETSMLMSKQITDFKQNH